MTHARAPEISLCSKHSGVHFAAQPVTDGSASALRTFLLDHVEDLEELEVLLCLYERGGDDGLRLEEVTDAVRFPPAAIVGALERLAARGHISCTAIEPALYRFEPANPDMTEAFARVAAAYRENPLEVMRLMSSIALERVRTAAIRRFADCFRIGGPKSRG
jgi:hypothetical protein